MTRLFGLTLLVLALVGAPAAEAAVYTVTLTNGRVFETRYQPQESSWDSQTILLMSDVGNWIGVPADLIESVVSDSETRGYGIRLDETTLLLGPSPNDAPAPGEEGYEEFQQQLNQQPAQPSIFNQSYDVQQFVEPSESGGGLPIFGVSVSGYDPNG